MVANTNAGSLLISLFERGPLQTRFALERILTDDGMGARAIAFDREASRRVVARFGRPRGPEAEGVLERLAELRHSKSAELVAYGRHRELVYALSAMVSGRRIPALLDEVGRLRLREFAPIASQLLMPVADAHSRGLGLGGLRIDDVFLQERNGRALLVKVIDLGLRRVFASPGEVALDDPYPSDDLRSDVFALGMILARMLTGVNVRAADAGLWWASQRHDAELGPELVALIGDTLERDPSRRPSDAQALVEALIDSVPSSMFRLPVADGSPCGDPERWAASWPSSPNHPQVPVEARPPLESAPSPAAFSLEQARPRRKTASLVALVPVLLVGIGIVTASSQSDTPPAPAQTSNEAAVASEAPVAAPAPPSHAPPSPAPPLPAEPIQGEVVIASTPPGELYIDGKPVGSTPFARPLPLGRHELKIVSEGHETWTATVVVRVDETSRFDVTRAQATAEPRRVSRGRTSRAPARTQETKPEPVSERRPFLGRGASDRPLSESSRDAFLPPGGRG